MIYQNFEQLLEHNRTDHPLRAAVVMAHELETLQAVVKAMDEGIALPVLIGDQEIILKNIRALGRDAADFTICHCADQAQCLEAVTGMLTRGEVDVVMKDQVKTGDLMRIFVKKENGFLRGPVLSHLALNQLPMYHKLLCVSDTTLNPYPDLAGKKAIIQNAADAMAKMGFEPPKVAVMAAIEYVNPKMKETVEAAALKEANQAGELTGCIVEGPISLDLALDGHAAEIKGYESPVAGDAALMLVPDLVSGNLLGKSLNYMPNSRFAGFITGACVPVVLTSRASSPENKYLSLAVACAAAGIS